MRNIARAISHFLTSIKFDAWIVQLPILNDSELVFSCDPFIRASTAPKLYLSLVEEKFYIYDSLQERMSFGDKECRAVSTSLRLQNTESQYIYKCSLFTTILHTK